MVFCVSGTFYRRGVIYPEVLLSGIDTSNNASQHKQYRLKSVVTLNHPYCFAIAVEASGENC